MRSAAAGIRSRAARCLLAPKHGLAALSLCLHSSFLVCALFLVSDNNSDKFGCCRWSLRKPGASLLVGRENGSQINQNRNISLFTLNAKPGAFINTHAQKLATRLPTARIVECARCTPPLVWCMRLRVRLLS